MKKVCIIAALLLSGACGGDDGNSDTPLYLSIPSIVSFAPVISNLQLTPSSVPAGSIAVIDGLLDYWDLDADIVLLRFSNRTCGLDPVIDTDIDLSGFLGLISGTITFSLDIDTNCSPGTYSGTVSLVDLKGHTSNLLPADFQIY